MSESRARQALVSVLDWAGLKRPLAMAARFARRPRTIREELDLQRDYWSSRREYRSLGDDLSAPEATRRVLFVSLSDWVAQVKVEGILGKTLELRGYRPIVLTHRWAYRALRYYRLFGFREFIFLEDLLPASDDRTRAQALRLLGEASTMREPAYLREGGVDVGRHVLSYLASSLRQGSVDLSDPRVSAMAAETFERSTHTVAAAERLLDRVRPDLALFLDKGYTPFGEIFDVLLNRDIPTIQWCQGHRADALVFKRYTRDTRHQHPVSLSSESWTKVRAMPWNDELDAELTQELRGRYEEGTWFNRKFLQLGKSVKAADAVRRQLGLDPSRKTAVIFSHVLWDATFFFGVNLFEDYETWLIETVRAACENPRVNWVVKLHPDYVWKLRLAGIPGQVRDLIALRAEIGTLPKHVKVLEPDTDISTLSIFAVTDYGLTVRGTVGIELPCLGIPVFTAGTGRYSGLGFTIDSASREEYLQRLAHIEEYPPLTPEQTELAKKHAYALLKLRPRPFSSFEIVQVPFEQLGHPLDHNTVIRVNSLRAVAEAPDLNAFADWAADSHDLDYLAPWPGRLAYTHEGVAPIPPVVAV